MIHHIHKLLVSNSLTRKFQRKAVGKIKKTLGVPDAFQDIHSLIQRTSPDALLDVGSHVGKTIARVLESTSLPIHGFEPTQESFTKLAARFNNNSSVTLHNVALSDKTGKATLHCNANEQTNSLLDNAEGNRSSLAKHTRHLGTQTINTVRLDQWMEANLPGKKVVIKSDVQGAEGMLLAGGMKTFKELVIGFYSEAQIAPMYEGQMDFCKLHNLLVNELGFVLHNIYPCFLDSEGRALQTDALWIQKAYLDSTVI